MVRGALPSEGPRHHVRITRAFYLGMYPVTQKEWEKVMGTNPSEFSATGNGKDKVARQESNRFPVEMVSWDDCIEFCRKLSDLPAEKKAGRFYRLPSEARWEYACRAGSTGRYCFSPANRTVPMEYEEHRLIDYGWFNDNSGGMTHPVGLKRPNAWELYDMHGNVWQWCEDWFDKDYYGVSSPDDPGPRPRPQPAPPEGSGGNDRVCRGGSWCLPMGRCRAADRGSYGAWIRSHDHGLRVVLVCPCLLGRSDGN